MGRTEYPAKKPTLAEATAGKETPENPRTGHGATMKRGLERDVEGNFVQGGVEEGPETPMEWIRCWSTDTSCNGVPNVARSRHVVRKLFWVCIVLIGTVLTVYNVVGTCQIYFSYPFNVKVTVAFKTTTTFPTITICNSNMVRLSKLHAAGEKLGKVLEAESGGNASAFLFSHRKPEMEEHFRTAWSKFSDIVKIDIGHQLSDMLISCKFEGKDCHVSDFVRIINPVFGNCFSFNSGWDRGELHVIHRPGPEHGLTMEMYVQQEEYIPEVTEPVGIRISVHHQDVMPFPEDSGILAGPGAVSLIGLVEEEMSRLQYPYSSNCLDGSLGYLTNLSVYSEYLPVSYSEQACLKTCYQRHVVTDCGCADPRIPMVGKALGNADFTTPTHPCSGKQEETCEHIVKDRADQNDLDCDCPVKCHTFIYPTSASQGLWPTDHLEERYIEAVADRFPVKGKHGIDPRRNLLRMQIFFQEMNSKSITEKGSYTLTNLYSDLGGNIGFYLGLSIVSVFEFLELACDIIRSSFLCVRRKKSTTSGKRVAPSRGTPRNKRNKRNASPSVNNSHSTEKQKQSKQRHR